MDQEEQISTGVSALATVAQAEAAPKKVGRKKKLAPKGTPERTAYQTKAVQDHRARAAEAEDQAAQQIGSDKSPKDDEAKEILRAELVKNPHVQDVLIQNLKIAAAHYRIPYNRYLLKVGLRKTLADLKGEAFDVPATPEDEIIDGEILWKRDLWRLWDAGYWRQPETFEQWLDVRFKTKSSAFYLGKEILNMDFHDLHEAWAHSFFPRFSPLGLKPQFSMEDAKSWLARQSEKKTFVLQCSRNSYKSSFAAILALTIILCQPSIRIRLVTATDDLASDFVAAIRRYFVDQTPDSPSLFVQLFGEYCIPPDEGQESMYDCPLAHLNLVAATCEASSMGSKQAGRRCDLLICDDLQEEDSVATESLREKGITRFDLLQKLIEAGGSNTQPGGYTISLSTPWHKKDISGILIERADADPDTLTSIRVDPAWEVLPHARNKPIPELQETDVKLLFPERLTFKFLMSEARKNIRLFESQNLCRFPDSDEEKLKVNFDLDALHRSVRAYNFFQSEAEYQFLGTYGGIDTAWSISKFADYSALVCGRIYRSLKTDRYVLAVSDIRLAQLRIPELAQEVVRFFRDNKTTNVVIERSGAWQSLQQAINREAQMQQIALPSIYWRPTNLGTQNQKAKMSRIKSLETPLAAGELVFLQHPMLDEMFDQLVRCDGSRSTPTKKDDGPDALSLLHDQYFASLGGTKITTKADLERQQQEQQAAMRDAEYQRYFGTTPGSIPHSISKTPEPAPPTNPLYGVLGRFGMTRSRAA